MSSDNGLFYSDNVTYSRAINHDYPGILQMAEPFYPDSVGANHSNGFLNSRFTTDMLTTINHRMGLLVAKNKHNGIIGFLGLAPFSAASPSPVVGAMLNSLENAEYQHRPVSESNPFIFGPVCVATAAKGMGVFKGLYQSMWNFLPKDQYRTGYAFVDQNNKHSLDAHTKGLGAKVVGEFDAKSSKFWIIAYARTDKADLR